MLDENNLIFREVQRFSLWLRLVVGFSTVFIVAFVALGPPRQDVTGPASAVLFIATGIILPTAIVALFIMFKLETEVRADGLYVRFFPFHIRFKKFRPEDLAEYYARTYRPIREYGGWGIKCGFGKTGKAYNVSGNKGVQLVLKNGKRLLVGSQKPDQFVEAIDSLMEGA